MSHNAQMPEPVLPPGMPNVPPRYPPVYDPADPDEGPTELPPEPPPYPDPDIDPPKPLRMGPGATPEDGAYADPPSLNGGAAFCAGYFASGNAPLVQPTEYAYGPFITRTIDFVPPCPPTMATRVGCLTVTQVSIAEPARTWPFATRSLKSAWFVQKASPD